MLDIETLATTVDAVICSIGAVDVYGNDTFYEEIDPGSQWNRRSSEETLSWWDSIGKTPPGRHSDPNLDDVLNRFTSWYNKHKFTEVWCNGSDFDFVILTDAYRKSLHNSDPENKKTPWEYNHVRDLRTLRKVLPHIKSTVHYANHNALVDAICQSVHLKELLNEANRIKTTSQFAYYGQAGGIQPSSILGSTTTN
jgi:hypothetical protein